MFWRLIIESRYTSSVTDGYCMTQMWDNAHIYFRVDFLALSEVNEIYSRISFMHKVMVSDNVYSVLSILDSNNWFL